MYKKIIVLFLLLGTFFIFSPSEGKAADVNNIGVTVNNATPGNSANIPQNRRRRWRSRRWQMRKKIWNRRSNRRDNRRDRREDRRDRRNDRRDDRRDRRN